MSIRWRAARSFVVTDLAIILVLNGFVLRPENAGFRAAGQDLVANVGWYVAINLLFLSVPRVAYLAYRSSDKRRIEAFVRERLDQERGGIDASIEGDGT